MRSDSVGKVRIGLLSVALGIFSSVHEVLAFLLLIAIPILVLMSRECHLLAAHELLVQRVVQDADGRQILIDPRDS